MKLLKSVEIFLCRCRKKAGGWMNKYGLAPGRLAGIPELKLGMSPSDLSLLSQGFPLPREQGDRDSLRPPQECR